MQLISPSPLLTRKMLSLKLKAFPLSELSDNFLLFDSQTGEIIFSTFSGKNRSNTAEF